MVLNSGGAGGGGSDNSSTNDNAEDQLTDSDPGSGDDSQFSGGILDGDDGGTQDATSPSGSGGGLTSGSGETVSEGPDPDPVDGDAEEQLTESDPASGDGSTSDTDSEPTQDARDQLTGTDPGSSGPETTTDAAEQLTESDPGSRDITQIQNDEFRRQAEQAAEEAVEVSVQEGVEGRAGRNVTVDGRDVDVQGQAQTLEQQAIDQATWADDPGDVAVVLRDGRLVAVPSRSAAVEQTADRFEENLKGDFETRRETVTLESDDEGEVSEEDLEEAEADLETAEATFSLPGTVTLFGPGGQTTDINVPFSDREVTLSGQTQDVELEQTESGDIEVVQQERFGDFDFGSIPETLTVFGPGGMTTEIDVPGGGGEFEDFTGAVGDRLVEGGQNVGDVLARELVEERTVLPGAIVEKQLTGDTSFVASATRGVGEGVGAIGDQALNLPQETAEFAVEGVQRTAAGEGREFAGDVGSAAVGAGIQTGEAAARNPGRFTGQLAGSAVGATGGVAAATRFLGPRAGRVVSTAVQPGEELAIAAARRGAISPRAAQMVPGVREGHLQTGSVESRSLNSETEATSESLDVEVEDPIVGRVEGAVSGTAISTRARVKGAQERVRDLSREDVEAALNRPVRAARQRGREMRSEIQGTVQGAQLSAEAQVTRGAEGLEELVREAQTPPRPEAMRVDLDADDLADSGVRVERTDTDEDFEASGEGVGSVGGVSETRTDSGVAVQRVRRDVEFESGTETIVEPRFESDVESRSMLETLQQTEPALAEDQVTELDLGSELGVGAVQRPEVQAETVTGPGVESSVESGVESRSELRQDPSLETRVENRQELRQEVAAESVSEMRSELDADPDLRDDGDDKRRRRLEDDFAREFEFGVAGAEEVLTGSALDDS